MSVNFQKIFERGGTPVRSITIVIRSARKGTERRSLRLAKACRWKPTYHAAPYNDPRGAEPRRKENTMNDKTAEAAPGSAPPGGYVVIGTRTNQDNGGTEVFLTPPRGKYPKDIAEGMLREMKELHPTWKWKLTT